MTQSATLPKRNPDFYTTLGRASLVRMKEKPHRYSAQKEMALVDNEKENYGQLTLLLFHVILPKAY